MLKCSLEPIHSFSSSVPCRPWRPPALRGKSYRGRSDLPGSNQNQGAAARLRNQPLLPWLRRCWIRFLIIWRTRWRIRTALARCSGVSVL